MTATTTTPDTSQPISPSHPLTASCFCATITLLITSPPTSSYICHCTRCRHASGSSFAHNASFPASSVTITAGAASMTIMGTHSDTDGSAHFCGKCGSKLLLYVPERIAHMRGLVIVPVGAVDGSEVDERLKPGREFFCKRREGWMGGMEGTGEREEF